MVVLVIKLPRIPLSSPLDPRTTYSVLFNLMIGFVVIAYQLRHTAISEVSAFRGFLRIRGWRDIWIWMFQAGLFSLAHLYYMHTAPISFWFIVPLGALILDEPTSSLNAEADYEIFERLVQTSKEQIKLLISHRFSTVRMADQILVLESGKIIEEGSHEELMRMAGQYEYSFKLQARGYEESNLH